jgi:hypothetical protein
MPNWDNKDRRISFLSVFSTLVGKNGIGITDVNGVENLSYRVVERLFKEYGTEEEKQPEVGDTAAAFNKFMDEPPFEDDETSAPKVSDQYDDRKPFSGKGGKLMYPVTCGGCSRPAWSPVQGRQTKSCKACR